MISNNTTGNCNGYSDFTSIYVDLFKGSSYSLQLDLGTYNPSGFHLIDLANVYIDWNIDGDFDDVGELAAQISPTQSPSLHNINIHVPINASTGNTRMRIVMQNYQYQSNNQALPCDVNTAWFGETEDYTLNILGHNSNDASILWSNSDTSSNIFVSPNVTTTYYAIISQNGISCTDSVTINVYPSGCTDTSAINYNPIAFCDDGSCISCSLWLY